jgi:nucleoside-triphosphatase THEP1
MPLGLLLQGCPVAGKYNVDVQSFEGLALPAIQPTSPATKLVVIDEVGEWYKN